MTVHSSSPRQAWIPPRQLSPLLSHSTQPQQPNLTRHVCNPLTLTGYHGLTHRGAQRPCSSTHYSSQRAPARAVTCDMTPVCAEMSVDALHRQEHKQC